MEHRVFGLARTTLSSFAQVSPEDLVEIIAREKPSILLCAAEVLSLEEVQTALLSVNLVYVAIDEAHVRI